MMKKQLHTAGLLAVRDNRLLLTFSRNKKAWYLPGGKVDAGETAAGALIREIEEELGVRLAEGQLTYYGHVTADAFGEQDLVMEQDCFLCELPGELQPSNEIEAVAYFSLAAYRQEDVQVEGVLIAFDRLIHDGLIVAEG